MTEVLSLYRGVIKRRPTGREIIAEVAELYQLTSSDLIGPSRYKRVAHPRQHAMWEVRQRTTLSLPQIGRIFGGRDHSTVHYSLGKHEARRASHRSGEGA